MQIEKCNLIVIYKSRIYVTSERYIILLRYNSLLFVHCVYIIFGGYIYLAEYHTSAETTGA